MKPIPLELPLFEQPRALMSMDDAEMALTLIELAATTTLADTRRTPAKRAQTTTLTYDAVEEFRSAAGMIMDKAEIEAAIKDLEQDLRHYPRAA
jgi:hypothetical protein